MAKIGTAYVNIVPKFPGLESSIAKAVGGVDTSSAGRKSGEGYGRGFSGGLGKSGALIGAASAVTTKALDAIGDHVGSAVARFDTMNNYPKVMESLGYSSEDAEASISKVSDRLQNLPTTLDSMTGAIQRIVPATQDVGRATDVMLALNDAIVAGAGPVEIQSAAIEQFSQGLSRGKFELEEWRSIQTAMPGQLDQVAKSMLGASAGSMDLYEALKSGSVTMDDFLDEMIRLDTEGGASFASFRSQAETAAGGVATAAQNFSNAWTKGIAGTMEAIGKENIAGVFDDMKGAVTGAFSVFNSMVGAAAPIAKGLYDAVKPWGPVIATGVAAFAGLSKVVPAVSGVASNVKTLGSLLPLVAGGAGTLGEAFAAVGVSINPVGLAIAGVSAAIGVGVSLWQDYTEKQENFTAATKGLEEAVSDATALSEYRGTIEGIGGASSLSAKSVDELAESTAKTVERMRQTADEAEQQIATLNTAQGIINQYAGQSDLSADAQGRLQWALKTVNDQLGLNLTATDVMNGSYTDAEGNVRDLTQSVNDLIEAKKAEARVSALTSQLTDAYSAQTDAAKTLAQAQRDYQDQVEEYVSRGYDREMAQSIALTSSEAGKSLESARGQYESATKSVDQLNEALGNAAAATSENASALDVWASQVGPLFEAQLAAGGTSISMLKEDLESLGASTDDLGRLSEEDLTSLAQSYDGTTQSIVGKLEELGVSLDGAHAKTSEAASGISEALGSVDGIGDVLSGAGTSVSDFAAAAANAGLTAQDFAGVSAESFQAVLDACDGNLNAALVTIGAYNSVPLVGKDGAVNVDQAQLWDAQGNVYAWNGTALVDKYGNAAVDGTSVVDATGTVWAWNGTALTSKDADAKVEGNAVTGDAQGHAENTQAAIQRLSSKSVDAQVNGNAANGSAASNIWNTVSAIGSLVGKTVTNFVNTVFSESHNAKGGIRPHADGGIRWHAGGSIVDAPGAGLPLDMVGEDGAEAIVPLTNTKYSRPFARTIAEQMREVPGALDAEGVYAAVRQALADVMPGVVSQYTPTIGRRQFARMARGAVANAQ